MKNRTQEVFNEYFQMVFELYWKTHTAHWNIVSSDFAALHKLLDEQYNDLWNSLDEIAEHLRSCDLPAPVSLPEQKALSFGSKRNDILNDLIKAQESLIKWIKTAIRDVDADNDISGADFLTERLAAHEKANWMLKSSL